MKTPLDRIGGVVEQAEPLADDLISAISAPTAITGNYISAIEMARLHDVSRLALQQYDAETQFKHLEEEMGELFVARARRWRNRSTEADILEELVDVFQCVVQMGVHHYGPEAFNAMLKRKNDKFIDKIMNGDLIKPQKKSRKTKTKSRADAKGNAE